MIPRIFPKGHFALLMSMTNYSVKNNSVISLFVAYEGVDSKKFNDFLGVERSMYNFFFA